MKTTPFFSIALALLLAGCSHSQDRYHPDYNAHRPAIARLLIMPPEIELFTTLPDGKLIRQAKPSEGAGLRTQDAIADVLSAHRLDVRIADAQVLESERRIGMRALYRNVNHAIQLHAYGPQIFPQKSEQVDYGVGSVTGLLNIGKADALMLVMGQQKASGRNVRTWISAAVIEPSGKVIWYGARGSQSTDGQLSQQKFCDLVKRVIQPFVEGSI
jgi:hypothetical protein